MARYRETPTCAFCGEVIAKAVYKKSNPDFIGDNFLYWDYLKHDCKNKPELPKVSVDAVEKEQKEELETFLNSAFKAYSNVFPVEHEKGITTGRRIPDYKWTALIADIIYFVSTMKNKSVDRSKRKVVCFWNGEKVIFYNPTDEQAAYLLWIGVQAGKDPSNISKAIEWCDEKINEVDEKAVGSGKDFYFLKGRAGIFLEMKQYLLSLSNINK